MGTFSGGVQFSLKNVLHLQYARYRHKMNTIEFIILSAATINDRADLILQAIYSTNGLHFEQCRPAEMCLIW